MSGVTFWYILGGLGVPRGPRASGIDFLAIWGHFGGSLGGSLGAQFWHSFSKMGVLEVIFYTFLAGLKKGMKMKVARKGPMCNPIEPARSDCMSAVVEKASFRDPFWSRFGVQVRYSTHFW